MVHISNSQKLSKSSLRAIAKQSIERQKERMDCFVASLLAMTGGDTTSHSRGMRPSFASELPAIRKSEGAGNAGRALRPQPRV
jgi:hypothetical protein